MGISALPSTPTKATAMGEIGAKRQWPPTRPQWI
jgi:hypothetical protein